MSPPTEKPGRISPFFMFLLIAAGLGIGFVLVVVVVSILGINAG